MGKVVCCGVFLGLSSVILFVLGVMVFQYFDPVVDSYINEELVLRNGSETFENWVKPPIVPYLKFYFFNLSNGEEFLRYQQKPHFIEIGPYAYREHWQRVNVTIHDNGTVSSQTLKYYYFDRSKSIGPEDDLIHTLNIPVTVAVDMFKNEPSYAKLALSSMLHVLNETTFITKTVNQFVWGYDDPLLDLASRFPTIHIPFKKFGFFYEKNGTTEGVFNVFTGENGMKNYTIINRVNDKTHLDYWGSAECNMLNGTDGTSYPPGIKRKDTLYLFNENICRSLPLEYQKDVEHYGIKGYRFSPPADVFASVSKNDMNKCYCVGGPPCVGGGVFNISVCKFDTPSILSWPHFFQADKQYLDSVVGLKPDAEKHQLFIDVAPRTGFPLSVQARIQVNFATLRVPEIKLVANMTNMVFPVVWFEDGLDQMPDVLIELLRKSSNLPEVMRSSLLLLFFILGGVLLIATLIILLQVQIKRRSSLKITAKDNGHVNPVVSYIHPD